MKHEKFHEITKFMCYELWPTAELWFPTIFHSDFLSHFYAKWIAMFIQSKQGNWRFDVNIAQLFRVKRFFWHVYWLMLMWSVMENQCSQNEPPTHLLCTSGKLNENKRIDQVWRGTHEYSDVGIACVICHIGCGLAVTAVQNMKGNKNIDQQQSTTLSLFTASYLNQKNMNATRNSSMSFCLNILTVLLNFKRKTD